MCLCVYVWLLKGGHLEAFLLARRAPLTLHH